MSFVVFLGEGLVPGPAAGYRERPGEGGAGTRWLWPSDGGRGHCGRERE